MTSSKTDSILSIDFGERYFGFAIKLKDESTIFPLKVLDTKQHDLLDYLSIHIDKYDPEVIIVGYPIGLSGNESRMSKEVDKFVDLIKTKFSGNIIKIDERFSSKINTSPSSERQDSIAALNILETYLRNE
ncbi:MAG: hypothetical protein CL515_02345 [Actinobacteria bacterium]|nr:hypothetical protein [Actinomycetota bacterium]